MITITGFSGGRGPTAALSFLNSPLSQGAWSDQSMWVVFPGGLPQESVDLCCTKYDLQATCLRMRGGDGSDFYICLCVSSKIENHRKLKDVPLNYQEGPP